MSPSALYQRILVGYDGTPRAMRAVERAVQVSKAAGARLTLLGVGSPETLLPALEKAAAVHAAAGVEIETRVVPGNPASALIEVAEEGGYDLLVLGNKGMTGIERLRLGAVPNKVSHHLPCSLLIVRTA